MVTLVLCERTCKESLSLSLSAVSLGKIAGGLSEQTLRLPVAASIESAVFLPPLPVSFGENKPSCLLGRRGEAAMG